MANKNQTLKSTVINDLKCGDLRATIRRDLKDLYYFYLDHRARMRLSEMNRLKRWFFIIMWLLKSMVLKLTTTRRILLLLGILFSFNNGGIENQNSQIHFNFQFNFLSAALILLVLMLELKDKLLARNELEAGRKVQLALLPRKNPSLFGWYIWLFTRPANDVGGDLVDYIYIEENRIGLALGDVAGKGLAAALVMAKLQASLRALVPHSRSLQELGNKMNQIICRDVSSESFASLIYFEIEAGSKTVKLLNAGHIPPVIIKNDKTLQLPHFSPALGLTKEAKYKEQIIELEKDEMMLLFSDGLSEARNNSGELFSEEKIKELISKYKNLPLNSIGKNLVTDVEKFVGSERQSDDLSIILIKNLHE